MTEKIVTVEMTQTEAETFRDSLADLLCWLGGFRAALHPEEYDRLPMGIEDTRSLNIRIKSAIEKAS